MAMTQGARVEPRSKTAAPGSIPASRIDFGRAAGWLAAAILLIMPLIANDFFLIESSAPR